MLGSQFGEPWLLTRRRKQTTSNLSYHAYPEGACDQGACYRDTMPCGSTGGVPDWVVKQETCGISQVCAKQNLCARPECSIGSSSRGIDPVISTAWAGEAPTVDCVYNANAIDTAEQLEAFGAMYGIDGQVMMAACEKPSDNCAPGLDSCTNYHSSSRIGDVCRDFYAKLPSDQLRDVVAQNACFKYSTDDCRCVNRTTSDEYVKLKQNNPIADNCWFVPCANPSKYFVPYDLRHSLCPENLCEVVFNVYKDRDVKIYQNDIVCDLSNKGGGVGWDAIVEWLKRYWPMLALVVVAYVIYRIARS